MTSSDKKLKITLQKSLIARHQKHKDCIKSLGLRRLHHTVVLADTPSHRGAINKVRYLLSVEEI